MQNATTELDLSVRLVREQERSAFVFVGLDLEAEGPKVHSPYR